MRQKGIDGSIPELLVLDWLDRNKIDYEFQVWLPDAHTRLDFLIHPRAIALRIQGEYWHRPEDQNDRAVRYALTLMGFKVIDAFENQIYTNLDIVMQRAIAGMEVGR